jgi:phosphate transport system permease protein
MTESHARTRWSSTRMQARLRRRRTAERRFRRLGVAAILTAVASLAVLLASIAWNGAGAFRGAEIALDIHFDAQRFGAAGAWDAAAVARADYAALVRDALRALFPEVEGRRDVRALQALASTGARDALRRAVREDPGLIGRTQRFWLPADDEVVLYLRGRVSRETPESERRLSDAQIAWIEQLRAEGRLRESFNARFLTSGDSREPELAGVWGAVVGSFLTLVVTLLLVFPLGVSAAVYLEEFAPKGRWTGLIEVNINNLAAVPSIVFGLLGLAVFLNTFQLPRSAPLVGGLTLALMTLPTIIITGRVAIQAVPPCCRWPCPASSRAPSSAWPGRWARRRPCS